MARFPIAEPEVAALAALVVEGLERAAEDFPTPPVPSTELRTKLDTYEQTRAQRSWRRRPSANNTRSRTRRWKTSWTAPRPISSTPSSPRRIGPRSSINSAGPAPQWHPARGAR